MINIIKQEIDIEEATKHLNDEMDASAKDFYKTNKKNDYSF